MTVNAVLDWNTYVQIDEKTYFKPFRSEGFYLVDSNLEKTAIIAECEGNDEARFLAESLNRLFPLANNL